MNEIFKNMDEIKTLYNQKVEENNAILNSYISEQILNSFKL